MSPVILPEDSIEPIQSFARFLGGRAITSAMGLPNLVIKTGRRVRFTLSITAEQVALNFEIASVCIP